MRWSFLPIGMLVAVVACSGSDSNPAGSNGDGGGGAGGSGGGGDAGGAGGLDTSGAGGDTGNDGGGVDNGPSANNDAGVDAGPAPENCNGNAYDAWVADAKMCVMTFATGIGTARQMAFAPNGDLFVDNGDVVVLSDANKNGVIDSGEMTTFATADGLNHGLAFSRDYQYVYASSSTTVYRWKYALGDKTAGGAAETVIKNIPDNGHVTRTLTFDSSGRLYVSVGSNGNIDTSSDGRANRQQIRRFILPATIPNGGIDYLGNGEVFASGMRNEVGIFIDAQDRLWGVENGRDDLKDASGKDIHMDNPGEKINLVVDGQAQKFYGYPDCYAGGSAPLTMYADQSGDVTPKQTDPWCRNTANVHPPEMVMQAHWAPLGIIQYTGRSLPATGDFIITSHGSWDRQPAVGRLLARAHYENGKITAVTPIVGQKAADGTLAQGNWDARPVDVRQGPDQALYFSDDKGGRVFKVGYKSQ